MEIGRLEKQDLRTIWPKEDADFTPWLAQSENLDLLSETLELGPLDRMLTEVAVGSFRADLVCKDVNDDTVVIENQFHRSDHRHLGQILTYLAGGENVRTVIWIAEVLREEHRAVLEWLNNNTSTDLSFFGVEVEAWRIGQSDAAPKFEVVVRPNNWVRRHRQQARASEMEDYQRRMEYWDAFLQEWPDKNGLSPPRSGPNQGWMKLAFTGDLKPPDGGGIYLFRMIAEGHIGVYLSIGRRHQETFDGWPASLTYPSLEGVDWEASPKGPFRVMKKREANVMDEADWEQQHAWMRDRVSEFFEDWRGGLRADIVKLVQLERQRKL